MGQCRVGLRTFTSRENAPPQIPACVSELNSCKPLRPREPGLEPLFLHHTDQVPRLAAVRSRVPQALCSQSLRVSGSFMAPQWLLELSHHLVLLAEHRDTPEETSWESRKTLPLVSRDSGLSHVAASSCKGGWEMEPARTSILEKAGGRLTCLSAKAGLATVCRTQPGALPPFAPSPHSDEDSLNTDGGAGGA